MTRRRKKLPAHEESPFCCGIRRMGQPCRSRATIGWTIERSMRSSPATWATLRRTLGSGLTGVELSGEFGDQALYLEGGKRGKRPAGAEPACRDYGVD